MKNWTRKLMSAIVIWGSAAVLLPLILVRHFIVEPKSFETFRSEAESAIAEIGGYAILTSEAESILRAAQAEMDTTALFSPVNWDCAPATMKLRAKLSPFGHGPWVRSKSESGNGIPEHVVIRFGSHSKYVWLLVFPSDNMPTGTFDESSIFLGGTVYLSQKNL
jgi:hypothetical protein